MSNQGSQHNTPDFQLSSLTAIVPAKNESQCIADLVKRLRRAAPDIQIIVVDDGSNDDTGNQATSAGAKVIRHPESRGNGAAVKSGLRAASSDLIVILDADGQHPPELIPEMLKRLSEGYDMVVASRADSSQASKTRLFGNRFYNKLAGLMVGKKIPDLTSGFRLAYRRKMAEFIPLYPNGFSHPTTSTMAFFRAGYQVSFLPFEAPERRASQSHIRLLRDGTRFLMIIFRIGTLYSPLKIFLPISMLLFTSGIGYGAYTIVSMGRFTNFGALLMMTSLLVFLIGLLSEQVTNLMYLNAKNRPD